jgi:hypothetical protein
MKRYRKILAFLLVLCMTAALLPVMGLAAVETRREGLYLIEQTTDISDTAQKWSWNASTKTLTLSGVNFEIPGAEDSSNNTFPDEGIVLPDGATIVLAAGTTNTIQFTDANNTFSYGIYFYDANNEGTYSGAGKIEGAGTLALYGGGIGIDAYSLTVKDATIHMEEACDFGVYCEDSATFNNATITAKAAQINTLLSLGNTATITGSKIQLDACSSTTSIIGLVTNDLTASDSIFNLSNCITDDIPFLVCGADKIDSCTFNTTNCTGPAVYITSLEDNKMANVANSVFNTPCQVNMFESVSFNACQFNLQNTTNGIFSSDCVYDNCYFNISTDRSVDYETGGIGILALEDNSTFKNCRGKITAHNAAIYGESTSTAPFTITDTQILSGGVYTEDKNGTGSVGAAWIATIAPEGTAISYDSDTGKIVGASTEIVFGAPFWDTSGTRWYYEPIMKAYTSGLIRGMTETEFGVDTISNRAMFTTLLYRMENEPDVGGLTNPFTDIEAGRYYVNAINWAYTKNIVKGMTETTVEPEGTLTREQLATMLYRYAQSQGLDVSGTADLSKYTDIKQIHNYAQTAMQWAVHTGIITGMTETTLAPQDSATRAQMTTMIIRFMETYNLEF